MTEKQEIFTLLGGKVRLFRGIYNPTSDAVWLAAFARLDKVKTVLDVGIGTGGVSLCILTREPSLDLTGIDISAKMIKEAEKNLELNGFKAELITADIQEWRTAKTFDLVVSNPPYFKGTPAKHNAHHNADLYKWTKKSLARVKPGGYFCTIIDSGCYSEVISVMDKLCGDITIFPLFGNKSRAERVLISGKLGSKGISVLYKGLSMNDERVLRDGLTIWDTLATLDQK